MADVVCLRHNFKQVQCCESISGCCFRLSPVLPNPVCSVWFAKLIHGVQCFHHPLTYIDTQDRRGANHLCVGKICMTKNVSCKPIAWLQILIVLKACALHNCPTLNYHKWFVHMFMTLLF